MTTGLDFKYQDRQIDKNLDILNHTLLNSTTAQSPDVDQSRLLCEDCYTGDQDLMNSIYKNRTYVYY